MTTQKDETMARMTDYYRFIDVDDRLCVMRLDRVTALTPSPDEGQWILVTEDTSFSISAETAKQITDALMPEHGETTS